MSTVNGENVIVIDIALDEDNNLQKIEESAVLENADIGFIKPYAGTSIPEGYLYCDGSAISRTAYPELFAAIGTVWGEGDGAETFNIPDLRGIFVRCDGGENNADIGVRQEDAIRDITGGFAVRSYMANNVTQITDSPSGAFAQNVYSNPSSTDYTNIVSGRAKTEQWTFAASNVVPTAAEVRPVNVAMKYCIRYI